MIKIISFAIIHIMNPDQIVRTLGPAPVPLCEGNHNAPMRPAKITTPLPAEYLGWAALLMHCALGP